MAKKEKVTINLDNILFKCRDILRSARNSGSFFEKRDLMLTPDTHGTFGGHHKLKIYGRLDCPSALRYIAKGQYVKHRIFFADEATAVAAGYRPCGVCMPEAYKRWKESHSSDKEYLRQS